MKTADMVALAAVAGLGFLGWQYMQKQQAVAPTVPTMTGPWAGNTGYPITSGGGTDYSNTVNTIGEVAKTVGSIFDMFND